MRRLPFVVLGFAACTSEPSLPPGTATVVTYPEGYVVFHGADGRVLDGQVANEAGIAIGPMESGGMVTYRLPSLTPLYETRGDIEPGDTIVSPRIEAPADEPTKELAVTWPPLGPENNLFVERVGCGERTIEFHDSPAWGTHTIAIPASCIAADGKAFIYAYGRDERAEPTQYATQIVAVPGAMTIDAWRTDFATTPVAIDAIDVANVSIYTAAGEIPQLADLDHAVLPVATPPTGYRVRILYPDGGEAIVERRDDPNLAAIAIEKSDLLPRITSFALGGDPERPAIEYEAKSPIPSTATIAATLTDHAGSGWTIAMRGPVRVPEVPDGLIYIDDFDLLEVTASITAISDGVTTRSTSGLRR